jgi:spoIIIJ-associated protein
VAAQRGGRRRAAKQDVFRDALVAALADHLDVDADRLAVTVNLDEAAVPSSALPASLALAAPGPKGTDDEADDRDRADEFADEVVDSAGPGADEGQDDDAAEERGERDADGRDGTSGRTRGSGRPGRPAASGAPERESVVVTPEELDEEAEAAADLLEGLLDAMDLPGDLRISVQDAHAEVEVVGLEEGVLIGRRGQTLDAVQELVRTAMQRRFERRSRVLVDVDGYRARRLEKLLERADEAVREVLASGEPQRLEPMDAIERRLVHQRVAQTRGVVSNSHGREPSRRIVIEPAD